MSRGVLGLGIDVVETERLDQLMEKSGDAFKRRVFTDAEIEWCEGMANPLLHFAARFAAKEAASKALGTGISGGVGWHDLEVVREEDQAPQLIMHEGALKVAKRLGVERILLSLTHTDNYAAASAVAVGD